MDEGRAQSRRGDEFFKGKVAVVTGAASGIGLAMAEKFAAEGMQVVMADIEPEALSISAEGLKRKGGAVMASRVDVTKPEQLEALAKQTVDSFGGVHVLCNNAGVEVIGSTEEHTLADWEWVIGVNLWGVIHGVRAFLPIMKEQGIGHIVSTASMAGLTTAPYMSVYDVTKHGVVALSEAMYKEQVVTKSGVGISVLCPGGVNTNIMRSNRNRQQQFEGGGSFAAGSLRFRENLTAGIAAGWDPSQVADMVFEAVRDNRFYIIASGDAANDTIRTRMEDILERRNPTIGGRM